MFPVLEHLAPAFGKGFHSGKAKAGRNSPAAAAAAVAAVVSGTGGTG